MLTIRYIVIQYPPQTVALAACLLLRPVPVADTEVEAEAEPVPAEAEAGSAEAEDGAAAGLKQARLEPTTNTWRDMVMVVIVYIMVSFKHEINFNMQ